MITGYNTDVEHDGVVYHVQTEDKGLETPLILSLVYSGGAILASKRFRYEDLIASGFSDGALSERLKRQHLLICAAIHAGRVGDLKRMAGRSPRPPPSRRLSTQSRGRRPREKRRRLHLKPLLRRTGQPLPLRQRPKASRTRTRFTISGGSRRWARWPGRQRA